MLLEVTVWGSETWFDRIMPLLSSSGFDERPDLHRADPGSDGELQTFYFDLTGDSMPAAEFGQMISRIETLARTHQDPVPTMTLVAQR